jgi:hypothetical protein
MMDKRLIYRVVLKVLFLILLGVLAIVLLNSLFTQSNDNNNQQNSLSVVELDVSGMKKGDIRKIQWEGKEVNVIYLEGNKFFTYINVGDSGNCPLFKDANGFKDVCTGTYFDFSGNQKDNKEHGFKLMIPPNYSENNVISIGKWKK